MRYRWLQSSLMPTMISVCLDNRFPCSPCMPGGRFRSLEKSKQGGPDVISIIRSSVPCCVSDELIELGSGQEGNISMLYRLEVVVQECLALWVCFPAEGKKDVGS